MTNEAPTIELICVVCDEPIGGPLFEAHCTTCTKPFHLQQRTDVPGKDCGDVWLNDESLGLDFACFICIHEAEATDEPQLPVLDLDDVLDLGEAAGSLGWSNDRLVEAAAAGRVKHRQTSSGTLLFLRRDLLAVTGE